MVSAYKPFLLNSAEKNVSVIITFICKLLFAMILCSCRQKISKTMFGIGESDVLQRFFILSKKNSISLAVYQTTEFHVYQNLKRLHTNY